METAFVPIRFTTVGIDCCSFVERRSSIKDERFQSICNKPKPFVTSCTQQSAKGYCFDGDRLHSARNCVLPFFLRPKLYVLYALFNNDRLGTFTSKRNILFHPFLRGVVHHAGQLLYWVDSRTDLDNDARPSILPKRPIETFVAEPHVNTKK